MVYFLFFCFEVVDCGNEFVKVILWNYVVCFFDGVDFDFWYQILDFGYVLWLDYLCVISDDQLYGQVDFGQVGVDVIDMEVVEGGFDCVLVVGVQLFGLQCDLFVGSGWVEFVYFFG